VAELITTEPMTGACKSPKISSKENRTAAIGVLKAAASAAERYLVVAGAQTIKPGFRFIPSFRIDDEYLSSCAD